MIDNRLELIWYQKNKRENIEPRILIEKRNMEIQTIKIC